MKNKVILVLFIIVFVLAYLFGLFLKQREIQSENLDFITTVKSQCNPSLNVCSATVFDQNISFYFKQQPIPLKPFQVEAELNSLQPDEVYIIFEMEGMEMGFNKYQLNNAKNSVWKGIVVLPVCSLGRNDWVVNLYIKVKDKYERAVFYFEQKNNL